MRAGAGAGEDCAAALESASAPAVRCHHGYMLRRGLLQRPFHWNAVMRRYLRCGRPFSAFLVFLHMHLSSSSCCPLLPDHYSLPIALKSSPFPSSSLQLHALAVKLALHRHEFTLSGLIASYSKSGDFASAAALFDGDARRSLGSWNAIIAGMAHAGRFCDAVHLFVSMTRAGLVPDDVTVVAVASACASMADYRLAGQVHKWVLVCRRSGRLEVTLLNSVVDMYGKCGLTDLARKMFDEMPERDISSWTTMITTLAMHGMEKSALGLFDEMLRDGVQPNHVAMLAVLMACTHGGMVEEGLQFLERMERGDIAVPPTSAHYGCVVDMLCRVGRVSEAKEMAEKRESAYNRVIVGTILGACDRYGDVEAGEWAGRKLLEADPESEGVYVALSNMYARKGMWSEVEKMRRSMRMRRKTAAKSPGNSSAFA